MALLTIIGKIFAAICLAIGEAYRYVRNNWRSMIPVAVLIVVICLAFYIKGCITNHKIEQTQERITADRIDEANKDAVSKTASAEVEQKTKEARIASESRERAIKRDSKEYQNTNAGERFCARFPEDSTCVKK